MTRIKAIFPLLVLLTLGLLPATVNADPISITGGTVTFTRGVGNPFTLTGAGLSVSGGSSPLNAMVSLASNGAVFGGQARMTGGSIDSQDGELGVAGPLTVGGSLYSPGASLLVLSISSSSFIAPVHPASGFVVVAPFTLTSGIVEGYESILGVGNPLFSNSLAGQGTTTLLFLRTAGGGYQLFSQSFTFGPTVTGVTVNSVPEPATLLLLGSGLAAFAGATRKKLRKKDSAE